MNHARRYWLWLSAAHLLLGCSSSKADKSGLCTPDPQLIAEARSCRADDQCPCGAHCELGECVATCDAAHACDDGQRCDSFGRCRDSSDTAKIQALSGASATRVSTALSHLLVPDGASSQLLLTADDGDADVIRVVASEGYQLECDNGTWQAECRDLSLSKAEARSLRVRRAKGAKSKTGSVRVFHDQRVETVTVEPASAPEAGSLSGNYQGTASLVALVVGDEAALDDAPGVSSVALPVTAEVFENGVIRLTDPLYGLSPNGSLVGELRTDDPSAGSVSFPLLSVERTPLTQSLTSDVLAATVGGSYSRVGSSLTLTLPMQYRGLMAGESLPRARWVLSLARAADLDPSAQAPQVPKDAKPVLKASAVSEPSDWAQAFTANFTPWSVARSQQDLAQLLFTWQATSGTDRGQARRVDACTESGRSVAAVLAAADEWRAVAFEPQGSVAPASVPADVQTGKNALLGVALSAASAKYIQAAHVTQATTKTGDGAVPCAVEFEPGPIYCFDGQPNTADIQLATVDRCAEIAEELQCDVQPGSGSFEFDLQLSTSNSLGASSCVDAATHVTGAVNKVCVLPKVGWNCGELVSCAEEDGNTSYSPGAERTSLLTIGGDLQCGDDVRALASAADFRRNQPGNTDTPASVVENALDDLAVLRSSPVTPLPSALALDGPRLLTALEYATEVDRARAADPALAPSPKATRYALRLLQQWLGAHALIAHEASQHWQVPDSIKGVLADPRFPAPADALTRSLDGYSLLLHPRIATALAGMDGAALAAPDYRVDWLARVPANPDDEQPQGLPIALVNTLEAQLQLLDVVLDRAWPKGDDAALMLTGRTLRLGSLALALADNLHQRAVDSGQALSWEQGYQLARAATIHLLERVLGRARAMQAGENALGIEDIDLPLYFYGGTTDPVGRFSAISDYLLGSGADGTQGGWASILVDQASQAADAVGSAYQTEVTRQYQAALSETATQNRLDDIRLHWGDLIGNLCGVPDGLTTRDLLEKWPDFNANGCYFAADRDECQLDPASLNERLDQQTVLYHVCVASQLQAATGVDIFHDPNLNRLLRVVRQVPLHLCEFEPNCTTEAPFLNCLKCQDTTTFFSLQGLQALNYAAATVDQLQAAQTSCAAQFPEGRQTLPSFAQAADSPLNRADCYRGTLGDAAFGLLGAQKDLEIARSQYADHLDAYEIEMNGCLIKVNANQISDEQRGQFNSVMSDLRSAKARADKGAAIAQGVKDCATASTMGAGLSGTSFGASAAASAVACGAAVAESYFKVESIDTQLEIDRAQAVYDDFTAKLQEQTDVKLCFNEAHQELVGLRTANQQIDQAMLSLAHAESTLSGGIGSAQLAYVQGNAALATAQGRSLRPPALDAWVDRDINTFTSLMRQARRVTYLAERAVEYEYQASLAARQDILAAETPSELAQVLSDLKRTSGTLGIGGHRPSSLKIVLSLRQHLLQLFDASKVRAGEQNLSEVERFRVLLNDPRFAVYEAGKYVGQRVPFSLTPLGALGGDTKGISIFGDTDCAERVWSVNASILGGDELQRGSGGTSFARVDLLKSNTFFSQWCKSGSSDPFQVASVRPSRNLFRDPEFGLSGAVMENGGGDAESEISSFSRARIQAYFNVGRDELEADDYENGETSELAARGLFGDYALFFPAGVLSLATRDHDGKVSYSDGLNLAAIDDILLRLDYISVAR